MKKSSSVSALLCAGLALALAPLASAQKYHAFVWDSTTGMTDLGTLGGTLSYANAINDSGEVVGYSYLAGDSIPHAFIWTAAGGMVDLGTLPHGPTSYAEAINSSGEIAGEGDNSSGLQVPLFWSPSHGFRSLGAPDGNGYGLSINDNRAMTGEIDDHGTNAFFWSLSSPTVVYLPTLSRNGITVGYDINNKNHITGYGELNSGRFAAFLWSADAGTTVIGTIPGADVTLAKALNDNDEVTGIAYFNGGATTGGFYWKRGVGLVTLPTLGGVIGAGYDINRAGQIVGWSSTAAGVSHAAMWNNRSSTPIDIGTLPGGTDSYAHGTNALGQVVGYSSVP